MREPGRQVLAAVDDAAAELHERRSSTARAECFECRRAQTQVRGCLVRREHDSFSSERYVCSWCARVSKLGSRSSRSLRRDRLARRCRRFWSWSFCRSWLSWLLVAGFARPGRCRSSLNLGLCRSWSRRWCWSSRRAQEVLDVVEWFAGQVLDVGESLNEWCVMDDRVDLDEPVTTLDFDAVPVERERPRPGNGVFRHGQLQGCRGLTHNRLTRRGRAGRSCS